MPSRPNPAPTVEVSAQAFKVPHTGNKPDVPVRSDEYTSVGMVNVLLCAVGRSYLHAAGGGLPWPEQSLQLLMSGGWQTFRHKKRPPFVGASIMQADGACIRREDTNVGNTVPSPHRGSRNTLAPTRRGSGARPMTRIQVTKCLLDPAAGGR
jgi:hypothetical protein